MPKHVKWGNRYPYRLGLCSLARHCEDCQPIRSARPAVSKVIWRRVDGNPHHMCGRVPLITCMHILTASSPHVSPQFIYFTAFGACLAFSRPPVPCDLNARLCRQGTLQLRRSLLEVKFGTGGNLLGGERRHSGPQRGWCAATPPDDEVEKSHPKSRAR